MNLQAGKIYLLQVPQYWIEMQPDAADWNGQLVVYQRKGSYDDLEFIDPRGVDCPAFDTATWPFTAWITCDGLTTAYKGNLFLAKPEWLSTRVRVPTDTLTIAGG